jgi:hypothetical protein
MKRSSPAGLQLSAIDNCRETRASNGDVIVNVVVDVDVLMHVAGFEKLRQKNKILPTCLDDRETTFFQFVFSPQ